jgi:phosphate starvation-inducible protein PhoH
LKKESAAGEVRQQAESELQELSVKSGSRPKSNPRLLKPLSKNISVSEQLKNPSILVKNTDQKKLLKELNQEIIEFAKNPMGNSSLIKDINNLFSATESELSSRQSVRELQQK